MGWFGHKNKEQIYTKELISSPLVAAGEHTYGSPIIHAWDDKTKLSIGRFCSIADDVHFFLGGNHRTDWVSTYPFNVLSERFPQAKSMTGHPASKGHIRVCNDVWIGSGAAILSGVTIGNGAVVGARCVVAADVAPYEIVAGNPMRRIRKRFTDEQIRDLEAIAWWNWSEERINQNVALICSSQIGLFIDRHKPTRWIKAE